MSVPAWTRKYLGIPYREGGRSHFGIDCWGFVCLVLKDQAGIELPSYQGTRADISDVAQKEAWSNGFLPIELVDTQRFDLLAMIDPTSGRPEALHCGVVIDHGWFMHARARSGVTIGRYSESERAYIMSAWRYRG